MSSLTADCHVSLTAECIINASCHNDDLTENEHVKTMDACQNETIALVRNFSSDFFNFGSTQPFDLKCGRSFP